MRSRFTLHALLLATACASLSFTGSAFAGGREAYVPGCPDDCVCEVPRDRFVNTPQSGQYTSEYVEEYFHASTSHTAYRHDSETYDGDAYGGGRDISVDGEYRRHTERSEPRVEYRVERRVEHRIVHEAPVRVRVKHYKREDNCDPCERAHGYEERTSYSSRGGYEGGYDEAYGSGYSHAEGRIERHETANLNNFQTGSEPGQPPQY